MLNFIHHNFENPVFGKTNVITSSAFDSFSLKCLFPILSIYNWSPVPNLTSFFFHGFDGQIEFMSDESLRWKKLLFLESFISYEKRFLFCHNHFLIFWSVVSCNQCWNYWIDSGTVTFVKFLQNTNLNKKKICTSKKKVHISDKTNKITELACMFDTHSSFRRCRGKIDWEITSSD